MGPDVVVILVNKLRKNSSQVSFVEDDQMIEAFSPQGSLNTFDVRILPWASVGGSDALDAKVLQSAAEVPGKDRAIIMQQIPGCRVEWKCLSDLLKRPLSRRIPCDIEMHNPPIAMAKHNQDVVDAKRYRINGEEIAGDDIGCVVVEESAPCLRRRFGMLDHVPGHG